MKPVKNIPPVRYSRKTADQNPFTACCIHSVPYLFEGTFGWEQFLQKCEAQHFRGAIVAPHGHGKSTLQMQLAHHLQKQNKPVAFLRLTAEEPRFPRQFLNQFFDATPKETILFLDGAEQLGWLAWRRFLKRTKPYAGLIITTHQTGRLATLYQCETSLSVLEKIVQQLAPSLQKELQPYLSNLFKTHQGNIRDCLLTLYDWTAQGRI